MMDLQDLRTWIEELILQVNNPAYMPQPWNGARRKADLIEWSEAYLPTRNGGSVRIGGGEMQLMNFFLEFSSDLSDTYSTVTEVGLDRAAMRLGVSRRMVDNYVLHLRQAGIIARAARGKYRTVRTHLYRRPAMWEQQEYDELDREQQARYRNPRDAARPSYSYLTPIEAPAAEPSAPVTAQATLGVKTAKPQTKTKQADPPAWVQRIKASVASIEGGESEHGEVAEVESASTSPRTAIFDCYEEAELLAARVQPHLPHGFVTDIGADSEGRFCVGIFESAPSVATKGLASHYGSEEVVGRLPEVDEFWPAQQSLAARKLFTLGNPLSQCWLPQIASARKTKAGLLWNLWPKILDHYQRLEDGDEEPAPDEQAASDRA